jgi:hypothetical protein
VDVRQDLCLVAAGSLGDLVKQDARQGRQAEGQPGDRLAGIAALQRIAQDPLQRVPEESRVLAGLVKAVITSSVGGSTPASISSRPALTLRTFRSTARGGGSRAHTA